MLGYPAIDHPNRTVIPIEGDTAAGIKVVTGTTPGIPPVARPWIIAAPILVTPMQVVVMSHVMAPLQTVLQRPLKVLQVLFVLPSVTRMIVLP